MTKKHRILFFLWKLFASIMGIRKRKFVYTHSESKGRDIMGVIVCVSGDSITNKKWAECIQIEWFEPIQGVERGFYDSGSYEYKHFMNGTVWLL